MADIRITPAGDDAYTVQVAGGTETTHTVTLSEEDRRRLGGDASAEDLLRASFRFLLERESNTMIMSRFDINVISRYFPEYEREIGRYL